jgi:hypothetical protein
MKQPVGWIGLIPVAALGLMFVYADYVLRDKPRAVHAHAPAERVETPSPLPGREGTLQIVGSSWVPLARTRSALNDFIRASQRRDRHGLAETLLGGEMMAVDRGTRVLVLERGAFIVQVRVLEGELEGETGWIPVEMVRVDG